MRHDGTGTDELFGTEVVVEAGVNLDFTQRDIRKALGRFFDAFGATIPSIEAF